jgi:hypothetical protein
MILYSNVATMHTLSWIYAHGAAEEFMQHDVLLTPNPVVKPEPGLHSVTLCNPKSETRQAFMFVWASNCHDIRGLVVFGDDIESVNHCCSIFGKPFITLVS